MIYYTQYTEFNFSSMRCFKMDDNLKKDDYVIYRYDGEILKGRIIDLNDKKAKILVLVSSKRGEEDLKDTVEVPRDFIKKIRLKI